MEIVTMVLSLLGGIALFLFGMSLMGDGLKSVAGNKLEAFLYKMTNTSLKGVALGAGVTVRFVIYFMYYLQTPGGNNYAKYNSR